MKNILKNVHRIKFKIYKILIFLPSLLLLLILFLVFKTKLKKYRKLISLRISKKYFGHLAVEPAILSAYSSYPNKIIPLVSFKKGSGVNNQKLIKIAKESFNIQHDFINTFIEHIYNFSFTQIRKKINHFYSPLLHPKLEGRETRYIYLLDTKKQFIWRKNAQNLILNKKETDFNLIIALRTSHNYEKDKRVSAQPWRDASPEDISYITKVFSKVVDPKKIYLLCNFKNNSLLKDQELKNIGINFLDENKVDCLELFSPNSILINNGNGIGSAAFALGIKTLYIHHTVWQFWHTSHSNAFCIPAIYFYENSYPQNSLENIINLVFSSKSLIPLDFQKDYYQYGIKLNKIKNIKEEILIRTIKQMISKKKNIKKSKSSYMGCKFEYSSKQEKEFWQKYISGLPEILKEGHKNIKLNISESFLDSFN